MKQANVDASLLGSRVFFSRHVNEIINKRTWHKKTESQASGRDDIDGYVNRISSKATVRDRRTHTHIHTHEQKHTHAHAQLKMGENCKWTKLLLSSWSLVLCTHGEVSLLQHGRACQGGCLPSGGWAETFTSYARICALFRHQGDCRAVRQRTAMMRLW